MTGLDAWYAPTLLHPAVEVREVRWRPFQRSIGPGRTRWQGSITRNQSFGPEWRVVRDTRDEALTGALADLDRWRRT